MSPRTTIVLLVLVALAGGGIWLALRGETGGGEGGRRLLPGLQTSDVTSITIRAERADTALKGAVLLARSEDGGWTVKLGDAEPVRARAERVRSLLEMLRECLFQRELSSASQGALDKHGLDAGRRVLVDLGTSSPAARRLEFGAVVSVGGVAVRRDGGWPPVEVDRQILDDVVADPLKWVETRLLPFDAAAAQSVRATFRKRPDASFRAGRESGQWAIREPVLLRADQGRLMRLIASLSAVEIRGPFESQGSPPEVLVRYDIEVPPRATPFVIEIGDGARGDVVPAREGTDGAWRAVSLAGFELVGQPLGDFRSRRLLDVEAGDIQDVQVAPRAEGPLHLVRKAGRLFFEPPADWGWRFLGAARSLPLDASAQSDFLQALCELEAADFEAGAAFESSLGVVLRHGAAGAPATEVRLRFGPDDGGKRGFARIADAREGRVKAADCAFLQKPWWEMLARQAYTAAWFSLATIEIEEPGKRKVVIAALGNSGSEPDFEVVVPRGAAPRRVPKEVLNPVTDKIGFLTVDRFLGHGKPEAFGLDRPRYVVRWHDSAKSQGVAPDSRSGQWVTWRIAERGPDGGHACDLDIQPGLVFRIEGRDLDPLLNLLEWAGR